MAKVQNFYDPTYVGDKKAAKAAIKEFKKDFGDMTITEKAGITFRHQINDRQRIATKLTRLSGIEVTPRDYQTWYEGVGGGDPKLFQKDVNKIIVKSEWEAF